MTFDPGNRSSAEIEREVERSRARLTASLEELRQQFTPGGIADQLWDYARSSGGAEMTRNLGRSVRDNPLPLLLIGAGIGWLMQSSGNNRGDGRYRREVGDYDFDEDRYYDTEAEYGTQSTGWAEGASSAGRKAGKRAGEAATSAYRGTARAADTASDVVQGAYESTTEAARSAGAGIRQAASATADYAAGAGDVTRRGARRVSSYTRHLAQEQPLALGAIGLALGALLGAGLPPTRSEDELFGETSDALKDQAKGAAEEQYEQTKRSARRVSEEVSDDAREAVKTAGAKTRSATRKAGKAARSETRASAGATGSSKTAESRKTTSANRGSTATSSSSSS